MPHRDSMQEIERKYLVRDDSYREEACARRRIAQGYLCSRRVTARIRISDTTAYLTIKGKSRDGGLSRFEWEREIPYRVAERLLQRCEGVVEKVRYLVEFAGYTFEVDEFSGANQGLVIAEVELGGVDEEPHLPPWIGDEVTGERCFYNSFLVRHPFTTWHH